MRTLFAIIIFVILNLPVFSQIVFDPQVLILAPSQKVFTKKFTKEVVKANKKLQENSKLKEQSAFLQSEEFKEEPENIRLMIAAEVEFNKNLDFFNSASFISQQYLSYRFYERFPNVLILLSNEKSDGDPADLKQKSINSNLQYVLNFPKIELYKEKNISHANITTQLYDRDKDSIVLTKTYKGDWKNPGFEFACFDKTINCTINNALAQALTDVIKIIASNNKTLIQQKAISRKRALALADSVIKQPFNPAFLKSIIPKSDSSIRVTTAYQCLVDKDKKKFVGFFLEQISGQDFKTFKESNKDKSINIITSKNIKEEGFLNEMPQTYAYIVKGIFYNNKWYYEKDHVTYFEAKSLDEARFTYFNKLQNWNFFKENSTHFNPEFWETGLFKKIQDLKKDPDWPKYGTTIWKKDELANREYIGLYEIIADALKKQKKNEYERFDSLLSSQLFVPAYEFQIKNNPADFSKYTLLNKKLTFIYSSGRSVFLNPVMVTNSKGVKTLRYYVAFKNSNEIYEWIYFNRLLLPEKTWHYGSQTVDQLQTVTEWNFSYDVLNDEEFRSKFVLLKEGNNYKYLKLLH